MVDKHSLGLSLVVINKVIPDVVKSEVALQLIKGDKGDKGKAGVDGTSGKDGLDGKTGVEGLRGSQGLVGMRGMQGTQGVKGQLGSKGKQGSEGKSGIKGKDGLEGVTGPAGPMGPPGEKGDTPAHKWMGTQIQFQRPDGSWGKLVQLQGPQGHSGGMVGWVAAVANSDGDSSVPYSKRVDVVSDNLAYKGQASPGASESDGVWRISRVTTNDEGDIVEEWASGNSHFNKVWDDREDLEYS